MTILYDSSILYNKATMPTIKSNGCEFVQYDWIFNELDQAYVDKHWNPAHARHALVDTKLSLASFPGAGIPGWEDFSYQVAHGLVKPTGLPDDPRVWKEAVKSDTLTITEMVRAAAAAYRPPKTTWARKVASSSPTKPWRATMKGTWHEWEIVEIEKERARQNHIEAMWRRADVSWAAARVGL